MPEQPPYTYVQQIQSQAKKNAAVKKELLSTIEGIYTQFWNLRVHKMPWIAN